MNLDAGIQILATAMINGFGVAIGTYLSQKHLIEKIVKANQKLKRRLNGYALHSSRKK